MTLTPALQRQRLEYQARLAYRVSSNTAQAIQRNCKNKTKRKTHQDPAPKTPSAAAAAKPSRGDWAWWCKPLFNVSTWETEMWASEF